MLAASCGGKPRDVGARQRARLGLLHDGLPSRRERGDVEPLVQRAGELGRDHGAERGDAEQPRHAGDRVVDARGDPGVLFVGVGEHRRGQRRDGRRQPDREQQERRQELA